MLTTVEKVLILQKVDIFEFVLTEQKEQRAFQFKPRPREKR